MAFLPRCRHRHGPVPGRGRVAATAPPRCGCPTTKGAFALSGEGPLVRSRSVEATRPDVGSRRAVTCRCWERTNAVPPRAPSAARTWEPRVAQIAAGEPTGAPAAGRTSGRPGEPTSVPSAARPVAPPAAPISGPHSGPHAAPAAVPSVARASVSLSAPTAAPAGGRTSAKPGAPTSVWCAATPGPPAARAARTDAPTSGVPPACARGRSGPDVPAGCGSARSSGFRRSPGRRRAACRTAALRAPPSAAERLAE
jgi:hypothetical protein